MPKDHKDVSIINIIQKMVANGDSENKIISTLRDLGVEEDKAKRLLLLGQADTFALLRSEISKIVADDVEKERVNSIKFIQEEARKAAEKSRVNVEKSVMADIKNYEKDITGQSKTFQDQISDTVKKFTNLSSEVREKLNDLGGHVHKIEVDMDEFKLKGLGGRNRYISYMLIIFGLAFCVFALYLFFTTFGAAISIDSVIMTVLMALIGITMLFVATLM